MLPSVVRTVVPLIVALVLGQAARIGLDLPEGAVTEIVAVALGGLYYWVVRALEQRYPVVGRWLLGAGLVSAQPQYRPPLR